MYQLAVNTDLLFPEAGPDPADRVRAAAAAGFDAVEMFGTFDKDVNNLAKVLSDNGMTVCSVVAEPYSNFTFPGTDLGPFFDGLDRGVENARVLGSPRIAVTSGGRGAPGSGTIDWPQFLSVLRGSGYTGPIGLEVFPTGPSAESLRYIRSLAADA